MRTRGGIEVRSVPPNTVPIRQCGTVVPQTKGHLALTQGSQSPQTSVTTAAYVSDTMGTRLRGEKCMFIQFAFSASACFIPSQPVHLAPTTPQRTAIALSIALPDALGRPIHPSSPVPSAKETHQGGEAALSCRLCLTACNLRQIDAPIRRDGDLDAR